VCYCSFNQWLPYNYWVVLGLNCTSDHRLCNSHWGVFLLRQLHSNCRPVNACLMCLLQTCCLVYELHWWSPCLTCLHQMLCLNHTSSCIVQQYMYWAVCEYSFMWDLLLSWWLNMMKFSQAVSRVKWLNGEQTAEPFDPADSPRELHHNIVLC